MSIKALYPEDRPSLLCEFKNTKRLPSFITFTRSSTATYVNSLGLIQTAAINQPRFDHSTTSIGKQLGLLIEESRTNLLTWSEDASQWLAAPNLTVSTNQTVAPDGNSTADQYLETASTSTHTQDGSGFTFVTSTVYTYSVFVKSINGRNFEIGFPTLFTDRFARFNLSTGTVQGKDAGVTAGIQTLANGWFRCWATSTCISGAGARVSNFVIDDSFNRNYSGDITKGIYIWGAQLEAGSFPTSYIPTTSSNATRSTDAATITGTNFSRWYRQDEGTLFVEAVPANTAANSIVGFDDTTSAERWRLGHTGTSAGTLVVVDNSSVVANLQTSANVWPLATAGKTAGTVKLNDTALATNGVLLTDTSCTLPTVTQMTIGTGQANTYSNGPISRLIYWPTRLSDTILQNLTKQ